MRFSVLYPVFCFLTCLGLLVLPQGQVQGQQADGKKADTFTINHLLNTAQKELNPDTAIKLFNNVFQLSKDIDYADGAFIALITTGIKYYEKEDYENERLYSEKALPWAAKSSKKDNVAWSYINIGEAYFCEGEYIKASEYYYIGLQELKKVNAPVTHTTANIYNSLGLVNLRLNQPQKALGYFNEAERMARKEHLNYQLAMTLLYKGEYYAGIHQPDSAITFFNEVMLIGKNIGKIDLEAMANANLGKAFVETGDFTRAATYLQLAIALAQNRFNDIVTDASYALGDVLYHTHKYKEAEAILQSALKATVSHNIKNNYIKGYTKLAKVYKAMGQYEKALNCMDTLAILKDSLTSTEKAKAFNLMEVKYKTAEKDKLLAQNEMLIVQQHDKITRKNIWMVTISGCVLTLLLISFGLYFRARQKQRLQAEKIKSLQQENRIGILQAVVEGEDKERTRIAAELHDGIGGMLSAAIMRFMAARHEKAEIANIPAYKDGMDMLREMGNEIRETAHNLMPEVLMKQSLPDAVDAFCHDMQDKGLFQVDFQCYGSFNQISKELKLGVYRIIQELLKNVSQHAIASHALVELQMHEQTMAITVEDNGKGFSIADVTMGMGLRNIQTRVSSLSGTYTLQSEPGKGTSFYIEFNLDPAKNTSPLI